MKTGVLTPGLVVSGHTTVRRRRELPIVGTVLVAEGDQVQSDSVIAQAERVGELRIVRVAEQLGLSPKEACERVTVNEGMFVENGAMIAQLRGLFGLFATAVYAPLTGSVEFISEATGHVGIRAPSTTLSIRAYIDGYVEKVIPGRGAVITSDATFVQGIFGVGGERVGVIRMLSVDPGQRVEAHHIPEDCEGAVLVGGHSPSIEALQTATARGAVGFVTGSIDDAILTQYVGYDIGIALTGDEPVPMSLIITEGFGSLPMNERVSSILRQASGARASINGATQVRAGALRPEIITRVTESTPRHTHAEEGGIGGGLKVGSRVRLIRVPYFGRQGYVTALPKELQVIDTGAAARVAVVTLEPNEPAYGKQEVLVPRANIELVEYGN